jgi:acetyl esterase/lipase
MVGENDPLLDDSLRLCARMVESGTDVRCSIFKGLGHGFLSVDKVIKMGGRGIEISIDILREMLSDKRF